MNKYPMWKYALILVACFLGVVYTVPNFFGESPAVQVSPLRAATQVDLDLLSRVEKSLADTGIVVEASFFDQSGVKIRFKDTDTQLRAKDALQKEFGNDFVVALNLISNSPRWLASLNALPMYLGLDLRGGVHFLLQVDMVSAIEKALDSSVQDLRQLMRSESIRYSRISRGTTEIEINFREQSLRDGALPILERKSPDFLYETLDRSGTYSLIAKMRPEVEKRIQEFALQQNITTLRNRVNELGVAEPIVQQSGADRIVVQLPGVQDTAKAKDILGRTATLEVRLVDEDKMDSANLEAAQ